MSVLCTAHDPHIPEVAPQPVRRAICCSSQVLEAPSIPKAMRNDDGSPYKFTSITYLMTLCGKAPAVTKKVRARWG